MDKTSSSQQNAPDFIGMGAPRAGTTWLYEVLRSHPKIWMPPIKELHYFDSLDDQMSYNRSTHKQFYRIKKFGFWRLRHYVASLVSIVYKSKLFKGDSVKTDLDWDCRFFGRGSDLQWYSSLFSRAIENGFTAGEFTPDYALMQPKTAKLLVEINPDLKALLMFRDPIERTWSNAVFYVTRKLNLNVNDISDEQWIEYCFREECLERSDYLRMYKTLNDVLPKEQIFVGYFDDVVARPEALVEKICSFLELETKPILENEKLTLNVNSSAKKYKSEIPQMVELKLFSHFSKPLEELFLLLKNETIKDWLNKYSKD